MQREEKAAKMREEEKQLLEKRVNARNAVMLATKCKLGKDAYLTKEWARCKTLKTCFSHM